MSSPLDRVTRTARGLEAERVRAKVRSRLFQAPEAPVKVDRYVLEARVGEGAMGTVYRARDPELQRDVAVKLLRRAPAGDKLLEEARAMAKLEHPNLLGIHDVGTFDGQVFLVMKFVDGWNLGAWLKEQRRPVPEVLRVFAAAARGLAAAHRAGVVHRDFKPENVLLDRTGHVVVADFGLARGAPEPAAPGALSVQTQAAGTPAYMAPELLDGGPATPLSDQFAFCVALHQALAGELPFRAANVIALRGAHERGPQQSRHVPGWLERIIARGLSVDPRARHASMDEVIALLERPPPRARRAIAVAAPLLAAVALTGWWLRPQAPAPQPAPAPAPLAAPAPTLEPAPEPIPATPPKPTPKPKPPSPPRAKAAASFNDVWDAAWAAIKAAPYEACYPHAFETTVRFAGSGEVREVKIRPWNKPISDAQRACLEQALRGIRIPPFDATAWPPVDSISARLND